MNEVPLGLEWPDGKERFARLPRGGRADPGAVGRRSGSTSRASTTAPTRRRSTTGPSSRCRSTWRRPARRRRVRRPGRRRLHHHVRQGRRAVHRHVAAGGGRGRGEGRPALSDLDMMIEVKVSFDHDRDAAMEATRVLGRAGAVAGAEVRRRGPGRDAAAGRRAARRADREPVHRLDRSGRARREDQAATSTSASRTWSSTRPGPDQESSCGCTARRYCRGCGSWVSDQHVPRLARAKTAARVRPSGPAVAISAERRAPWLICGIPPACRRDAARAAPGPRRRRAGRRRGRDPAAGARRRPGRPVRVRRRGCAMPGWPPPGRPGVITYSQEGVHPADPAVPGPLPLLHVRHHAEPGARARSCRRTRCSRSPSRARRWAARRRCSPSATGRRTAWPAAARWLDGARLRLARWPTCARWRSWCWRRPGCCRT